jgi:hypothetical protein
MASINLACFQTEVEYACFVIDGKDQHVQQSDDGMAMERSTEKRNSDRWILQNPRWSSDPLKVEG